MRGILLSAAGLLTILIVAPASAQMASAVLTLEEFSAPPLPIPPDGVGQFSFTWKYTVNAWGIGLPGKATIHWTWECPEGIALQGPKSSEVSFTPAASSYTGKVRYNITVSDAVPGLHLMKCEISGQADAPGPGQPPSNSVAVVFPVVAEYVGNLFVSAPAPGGEAAPGSPIVLQVRVESRANAQSNVLLQVLGLAEGWSADLPEPFVLDMGEARDVDIVVHAPPGQLWTDRQAPVLVQATPVAALDDVKTGYPATAELMARSRGVELASPTGALALVAILGLGVGAWVARRKLGRKQD